MVDDDTNVLLVLKELFCEDYDVLTATSGQDAVDAVKSSDNIATVVLDIKMPGIDGIAAGKLIREHNGDIPVIFHTGYPGDYEEDDLDVTEEPFDYVVKGTSTTRLIRSVRNAVDAYLSKTDSSTLRMFADKFGIYGGSAKMLEVLKRVRKVAAADNKVMILGETGTGKELFARAIHRSGRRASKRLGIVNCNHKTTELVEAELFGYKKGAFTGAHSDRRGLFEITDGGTVFLDEIGDLSSTTQIALLRVLETGEFQQIGPEADVKQADVRIICATHRDLDEMVKEGSFREDLYYRLKGATIMIPPLRERREDIPILIEKFRNAATIQQGLPFKSFASDALNSFIEYEWPGNVRQLKDVIESLIVLSDSDLITADDVSANSVLETNPVHPGPASLPDRLKEVERTLIVEALTESGGNISAAAALLDIERSNLSRKIKAHGIEVSLFSQRA